LILGIVPENVNSKTTQDIDKNYSKDQTENKIKVDLLARKKVMEKARKELPYVFQGKDLWRNVDI
jgi:hypothetical protein